MHAIEPARVRIVDLFPHEPTLREQLERHIASMERTGVQHRPIAVYQLPNENVFIILDGHHRTAALEQLGYRYVMATRVDYLAEDIRVGSWRDKGKFWDKDEVISRALDGKLFEPKTTMHQALRRGKWTRFHDHPKIMPVIDTQISELRR